ncbi:MarR family transcriptional regulator [Pseudorhizobium endolithicum]|uniref:MarR family transcriptional regulator n=2 Tax=Pseudorhizobium endolithicum TaxID=1191678 RepID=A0ABM8PY86_9HYPH|nr:MarR family transcriptional regulator [Pseudorhizobium endolithicum]
MDWVKAVGTFANEVGEQRLQTSEVRMIEKAVRRIVRAHDLQSRALAKKCGLTSAQLVLMKGIVELGQVTSATLSVYADISPATTVTILDNLEERGLIERYRSAIDRRIVHTRLTEEGAALVLRAPEPVAELFLDNLGRLTADERRRLSEAAARLAELMSVPGSGG